MRHTSIHKQDLTLKQMAQSAMWQAQLNQLYNLYLRMVPPMSSEIGDDIFLDLPMVYSWFYHGFTMVNTTTSSANPVPRCPPRCPPRVPPSLWPSLPTIRVARPKSISFSRSCAGEAKTQFSSLGAPWHGRAARKTARKTHRKWMGNGWEMDGKWMEMDGNGWKSGKIWSESAKQCR